MDPLGSLAAISRALLPGGRVILEVPSGVSWSVRLLGEKSGAFTDEHLYFHTPRSLRVLLHNAGFHGVHVRTYEGYSGIFNTAVATTGLATVIGRVASFLRPKRGSLDDSPEQPSAAPVDEPVIDAGRNAFIGTSMVAGVGLTPLRWVLSNVGLGGALIAIARKGHAPANAP